MFGGRIAGGRLARRCGGGRRNGRRGGGRNDGRRGNSSSSLKYGEAQTGGHDSQALGSARIHVGLRIASMDKRTNEARMKLA
jgi:hypothetical protein